YLRVVTVINGPPGVKPCMGSGRPLPWTSLPSQAGSHRGEGCVALGEQCRDRCLWGETPDHYNCIGRMYSVSPIQIELFHLRLLLLTVKGAISQSFSTACLALGLIEGDDEWKRAMNEAVGWMMPRQIRRLFVLILLYCQSLHPEELWENFKVALSENYIRHFGLLEGVDLQKDVFNHGQLYVAFSRVRSWKALRVYLGNQRDNKQIKNYIYKEIYK
ncbi:hypothetical protein ALC57_15419, partial [Trachymyrmex cornetzi]